MYDLICQYRLFFSNFSGNDIYIKKIGRLVVLIPKDDPWSSLISSLDQFTDDFMNNRNQPDQDSREKF